MVEFLISKMHDARFMTMLLAAIAASATAYTLIMPLFAGEGLAKRMKAVASERERLRQRERDRLSKSEKVSLRQSPKQLVSKVVEDFNLTKWLAQEAARDKLIMAGYRGHAPYVTFLFARAVTPILMFVGAALYVFVLTLACVALLLAEGQHMLGGGGLRAPAVDLALSIFNLIACTAYIYLALGPVYQSSGVPRIAKAAALATAVGAIFVGYRFAIFAITLVTT
jgi:tight adherence protein C